MTKDDTSMPTKQEATTTFARLIRQYGLQWGPRVPATAHVELARANLVLSEDDRRAIALGRR